MKVKMKKRGDSPPPTEQKKEVIGRMGFTEKNVTGPTHQNEMTAKEVGRIWQQS